MQSVIFELKTELRQRVDVSPLIPFAVADLSEAQIAEIALQSGNRRVRVGELFDVQITSGEFDVVFRGGSQKLDYIGRASTAGRIRVDGDAGAYLGLQMKSGEIHVTGDVGIFCAAEMRGGKITVEGSAGDFLAAALPGNRKGMAGGVVLIRGSVGARAGDHMRRGVLLIEGDSGAYLGARMVAGTIAVAGRVGAFPGFAMKRGTLLLLNEPDALPPTFNDCGTHTLGFLPLLIGSFSRSGSIAFESAGKKGRVRRYAGDLAVAGKGELLISQ